jgi:hypothetical protein
MARSPPGRTEGAGLSRTRALVGRNPRRVRPASLLSDACSVSVYTRARAWCIQMCMQTCTDTRRAWAGTCTRSEQGRQQCTCAGVDAAGCWCRGSRGSSTWTRSEPARRPKELGSPSLPSRNLSSPTSVPAPTCPATPRTHFSSIHFTPLPPPASPPPPAPPHHRLTSPPSTPIPLPPPATRPPPCR